ncbi:MAG: type II toxin-antitoxin system Phd/YefM family antitoxin [bacterium]|nr:type II toxin-antitoxin system Phd/YefM family antitoxin [bacterium]
MPQTVSVVDARNNFSDLLGQVYYGRKSFLIEKLGKPFAALVNLEEYQKLGQARDYFFDKLREQRNKNTDIPFARVKKDIEKALVSIRKTTN